MRALIVAAVLGVAANAEASGLFTGNDLYQGCSARPDSTVMWDCMGYIAGVTDTMLDVLDIVKDGSLCIPPYVTRAQLKDVVFKWLEANPEKRHFRGSSLVSTAISLAFPCSKK